MRIVRSTLCLVIALAVAAPSMALTTGVALGFSDLELIDAGGMAITFEPMGEPTVIEVMGVTDFGTEDDHTPDTPITPTPGVAMTQFSGAAALADAPGGMANIGVFNSIVVSLDNRSGSTAASAVFEFDVIWDVDVSRTDLSKEIAVASAFFHLTGFAPSGGETLEISETSAVGGFVSVDDWLWHPIAGFPPGDVSLADGTAGGDTVWARVTVPAGRFDQFSAITDAVAFAKHADPATPEPTTAVLGALGFAGLLLRRRR